MSSPSDPVDTTCRSFWTWASPIFMIEPLPNCFSICASAATSALLLLSSIAFIPLDFARERLMSGLVWVVRMGPLLHRTNVRRHLFGLGQTVDEAFERHPNRRLANCSPVAVEPA